MTDLAATPHRYPLPFVPRDFYYLPRGWLARITRTAELDTVDLLFSMLQDESGLVIFPPDADEASWTRNPPPGEPTLLSHVAYGKEVGQMLADERLVRQAPSEGYRVADWPDFGDGRVTYRPRAYCAVRWPHYLGKNAWGPRAALLSLAAALAERYAGSSVSRRPPMTVTAPVSALRGHCRQVLPGAGVDDKVGDGLSRLARLALVTRVAADGAPRAARDPVYAFDPAALAQRPAWPPEEIARLCRLDPLNDAETIDLIAACLKAVLRPVADAPEIWAQIRNYQDVLASEDDYGALHAYLRQQTSRTLLGLEKILHDFAARQRKMAAHPWVTGAAFVLPVAAGSAVHDIVMPERTHHGVDAIQLVIRFERGRVSIADAQDAAERIRLMVDQDGRQILLADGLPAGRAAVRGEAIVSGNQLMTSVLQFDRPFSVVLLCKDPPHGLALRCAFRLRLARPTRRHPTPDRAGRTVAA